MLMPQFRYRLELRAATYPREVWTVLRRPKGGTYRFVEYTEAETARDKLLAIQPHAIYRIVDI